MGSTIQVLSDFTPFWYPPIINIDFESNCTMQWWWTANGICGPGTACGSSKDMNSVALFLNPRLESVSIPEIKMGK